MFKSKHKRELADKIFSHLLLIILSFIVIMPILFAFSISFQTRSQVFTYPPSFIPDQLYFGNYIRAWNLVNMGRLLTNSLIASVIVMVGKLTLGVLSGYAFSHFEFKGKKFLFFAILFTLMLPMQVRVVPLFDFVSKLGWTNTYTGLVMPFLASATTTFLMRQHFLTIPKSLMESAQLDGCGPFRFLFQILIPLSGPTLAGLATVNFLVMWNAYLWPLIILNSDSMKVSQQGIRMLFASAAEREWGLIMAGTIMVVIPTLVVFLLAQKFFVKGIATQGIKE
ncbi:carbohydrate ABC transporter membrane protein 2 (CUT1 family) [Halanaerobium saccharolyticum]|uniref:Carbohydrate ABC transporter membrane protein 2 (CUT1 family) n=1 Tax=Halanaerobium saccharolyticum TaxID=43595 RepID=A0A4R7ZAV6_9FIRM|nr:carbohydrate ABC transporter permease [Halanaerobium saccharolyticum]RAK09749.1 carbohydrate ABC transporter membrane protein 2 (CUT1 family) [Halanaerobium saccharolyticum]TDW07311.1 carbohydrate ABC transporter membrane protein 2 (CUT1 family) [Halanaerobium saccharolyticum]TDX61190.1 carbohydrate ABC transporter membrane protein 2 (CUT1 family) [Halanaerobium saccharolyticum]